MENSKIAWTHHTWSPWRGCVEATDEAGAQHPACDNCYAKGMAKRNPGTLGVWGTEAQGGTRIRAALPYLQQPIKWNKEAEATGERRRVFCASISDVFEDWRGPIFDHKGRQLFTCPKCGWVDHDQQIGEGFWEKGELNGVEIFDCTGCSMRGPIRPATMDDLRRDLFKMIDATPWLDWLLLTKRPENIRQMWIPPDYAADQYQVIEKEEVRAIPGFPGYFISNLGVPYTENGSERCIRCGKTLEGNARKKYCGSACRQASWKAGATSVAEDARSPLSPDVGDDGHCRVTLFRNGERFRHLVHHLVLTAFVRGGEPGEQGCHRDRNPKNNRLDNVRWGTQSSNWDDSKRHGTSRRHSKLTEQDVVEIRASDLSSNELAAKYGVSSTQINNVISERQWRSPFLFRRNVFLGTSISDQHTADIWIPRLLECRDLAPVLFASIEPLLGSIDFSKWLGYNPLHETKEHGRSDLSIRLGRMDRGSSGRIDMEDCTATEKSLGRIDNDQSSDTASDRSANNISCSKSDGGRNTDDVPSPQVGMALPQRTDSSRTNDKPQGRKQGKQQPSEPGASDLRRANQTHDKDSQEGESFESIGREKRHDETSGHGSKGDPSQESSRGVTDCLSEGLRSDVSNNIGDSTPKITGSFWIIIGNESKGIYNGRTGNFPPGITWDDAAIDLVQQFQKASTPIFVKQCPGASGKVLHELAEFPTELQVRQFPGGRTCCPMKNY